MYPVILYYNFASVDNPEEFCRVHKDKCRSLALVGRVYIASEGINGTLSGTAPSITAYKQFLTALKGFEDTQFKDDACPYVPFDKLIVRVRPEIVAMKPDCTLDVKKETGAYLDPSQWRKVLETEKNYVLIDVRNNYESKIGHFEGAITPDVENFYDFPKWLKDAGIPRDKKVLMYCTGGIRCEKFSAYMKKQGYDDVNQLHGGIINYAQKEGGAHYKGKCFVFDDRLAVDVSPDDQPVSRCEISGVPCDTYINCANPLCNKLFICAREAAIQMEGCCSDACRNTAYKRPFNPDAVYAPFRKWYHYFNQKPPYRQIQGESKDG